MPETVKVIAKKAEVSHIVGIIAHCGPDSFYSEVNGGFENGAHSLNIGNSFFAFTRVDEGGSV